MILEEECQHSLCPPAEKAGIPIGSIIKKVDCKEASGIDETSERIRGKIGTKVKLTCEYNGKIKKYTLKRDNIDDSGVESRIFDFGRRMSAQSMPSCIIPPVLPLRSIISFLHPSFFSFYG